MRARIREVLAGVPGTHPERRALEAIHGLEGLERGAERDHAMRELLSALMRDSAVRDRLIDIARHDPSADIRRIAIVLLGRCDSEEAQQALWGIARSPDPEDRRQAVGSLAQGREDLCANWTDGNLDRLTFVDSRFARSFGADTASGFLRLLNEEGDAKVLCALVSALGRVAPEPRDFTRSVGKGIAELPIVESLIRTARTHPVSDVRLAAMSALQDTKAKEACEFLAERAETDAEPCRRAQAAELLYGVAESAAVQESLQRILAREKEPKVLRPTVEALRLTDDNGVERRDFLGRLREMYVASSDAGLRTSILRCLSRGGPLSEQQLLEMAAAERDPGMKAVADELLRRMAEVRARRK